MDAEQVYGLKNREIIPHICALDTPFIRQVSNLAEAQAKQLKAVSIVLKGKANNRGELANRSLKPSEKSVLDLTKLTPLTNTYQSRNVMEEIAQYRAQALNLSSPNPNNQGVADNSFWKNNQEMLLIDYLLSTSLCYIEIFDNSSHVTKFFATRNRYLAGEISNQTESETAKYVEYLTTYSANYETKKLKVLKLNVNKEGFKIVQPRNFVDFNKTVKITPLFLTTPLVNGISDLLQNNIIKFTYIKDNLQQREFITTLSLDVLNSFYEADFVQKMMSNVHPALERGYIKLPELGISKYDKSGVRALNISRITSMEVINDFDSSFINVDFETIMPTFRGTVEQSNDPRVLNIIYEELTGKPANANSIYELKNSLLSFVESQYAVGTTTALRYLHKYMSKREQFFPLYHGGTKTEDWFTKPNNFDLGVVRDKGVE